MSRPDSYDYKNTSIITFKAALLQSAYDTNVYAGNFSPVMLSYDFVILDWAFVASCYGGLSEIVISDIFTVYICFTDGSYVNDVERIWTPDPQFTKSWKPSETYWQSNTTPLTSNSCTTGYRVCKYDSTKPYSRIFKPHLTHQRNVSSSAAYIYTLNVIIGNYIPDENVEINGAYI